MLRAAIAFFVIALIAAFFGFGGLANVSADIGQILLFAFIALLVIGLVLGTTVFRGVFGGTRV